MKTVTMRVDDAVYELIKSAAEGQKRKISSFIEFATMQYLTSSQYVEMDEMEEISADKSLRKELESGLEDLENEAYTVV